LVETLDLKDFELDFPSILSVATLLNKDANFSHDEIKKR